VSPPCIQGLTLHGAVEDVQILRDTGRISREQLEKRLERAELDWLDHGIQPDRWYPIESYARFAEILLEVEGSGDPEYMVRRGAAAAERLYATGLYEQFRHGEERRSQERTGGPEFSEADGRIMTSLSACIFDFGSWEYTEDEGEVRIEVTRATPLPELARLAAHGFIAHVISRVRDTRIEVQSTRPAPDNIVFRFRLH
jgi:hypothetical protein